MNRRTFVTAGGAALLMQQLPGADRKNAIIELRRLQLRNTLDEMGRRTNDYLSKGMLPAMQRLNAGPIGVFGSLIAADGPFALIVSAYPSLAAWDEFRAKLSEDKELVKQRQAYHSGAPGYVRMDVSLLRAFNSIPNIEVPPAAEGRSRVFELRTYESNNLTTLARKIRMFDEGEIALFRKLNMRPVFFGETIAGANMPNLTYMLVYDDLAAREKAWAAFVNHPEWNKMKSQPGVSDAEIVSNISNAMLRPMPFSQIK